MPQAQTKAQTEIIQAAEALVKKKIKMKESGHDWHHIDRVRMMALHIAQKEGIDTFLVEVAALLHELPDRKIAGAGNEKKALVKVRQWLAQQQLPESQIDEVLYIIENQSYSKSGLSGKRLDSEAGRVVQDADRLDALGAIGIARAFVYAGRRKGQALHDPAAVIRSGMNEEEYLKEENTVIQHFYEKLLKLKDLMNTKTAQRIAQERHTFMEQYLEEFFAEWDGKR